MHVAVHPDKGLLDQVLAALPVTHRTVDEVQQPSVVALDQLSERALVTREEGPDDFAVVQLSEHLAMLFCRLPRHDL